MKSKILYFLMMLVFFSQCKKDFLDKSPKDRPTLQNFFVDATSARQADVAIFPFWTNYWLYGNCYMPTYSDICTDDAWLYGNRTNSWRTAWSNLNISPSYGNDMNYHFTAWWQLMYGSINAANFAIEYIPTCSDPKFTPELQKKYIGVAKMMRAFAYINLTCLWGDIPIYKNFTVTPSYAYAKSPQNEIYQFAIEDLKYAVENIPNSWDDVNDQVLPKKAVAAGFLARAYLYAKDFSNAETAAKNALDIANTCGFRMEDDYVYMMSEASQPNKEFIFAFEFLPNEAGAPLTNQGIVYRGVRDDPGFIQALTYGDGFGYAVPTRNLVDAFEPGDPRRKASMWLAGDYFGMYIGEDITYTNSNVTPAIVTTYHEGDTIKYQNGWSFGNVNTRKIQSSVKGLLGPEKSGYDIPVLRYAELYLYYAEALIENNKIAEGMAQLNKVRARPSVNMPPLTATDQADARAKLRHERRIELNMEGIRMYDLRRWNIMEEVFGAGPNTKKILGKVGDNTIYKETNLVFPRDNLFPIPQEELDANPLMTQNPGY